MYKPNKISLGSEASVLAPKIYNRQPTTITSAESLESFKEFLKTFLLYTYIQIISTWTWKTLSKTDFALYLVLVL